MARKIQIPFIRFWSKISAASPHSMSLERIIRYYEMIKSKSQSDRKWMIVDEPDEVAFEFRWDMSPWTTKFSYITICLQFVITTCGFQFGTGFYNVRRSRERKHESCDAPISTWTSSQSRRRSISMVSLDIISGNADSSAFKTRRISRCQRFESKMNVSLSFDFFQLSNFIVKFENIYLQIHLNFQYHSNKSVNQTISRV